MDYYRTSHGLARIFQCTKIIKLREKHFILTFSSIENDMEESSPASLELDELDKYLKADVSATVPRELSSSREVVTDNSKQNLYESKR